MNTEIALTRDVARFSIRQSASWRLGLCQRFPGDTRNKPAAEKLAALADDENVSEELLAEVVRTIPDLRPAISNAAREVGFRRCVETFDDLLRLMLEQSREATH